MANLRRQIFFCVTLTETMCGDDVTTFNDGNYRSIARDVLERGLKEGTGYFVDVEVVMMNELGEV